MAAGKPFVFYMQNATDDYYFVDSGTGLVDTTSTKTPIEYAPDGWRNTQVKWGRSLTYWGLQRTLLTPLKYNRDAAQILRSIRLTLGHGAYCKISIEWIQFDGSTNWDYSLLYQGVGDFSTFVSDDDFVTINTKEGGLADIVTSKDTTPIEIPILDVEAEPIYMDGIDLQATYNFIGEAVANYDMNYNGWLYFPLGFTIRDGDYDIGIAGFVSPENIPVIPDNNYIFTASQTFDAVINMKQNIFYEVSGLETYDGELRVYLYVYSNDDFSSPSNFVTSIWYDDGSPLPPGSSATRVIDTENFIGASPYTITLNAGDKVVMFATVINTGNPATSYNSKHISIQTDGIVTIGGTFRLPVSTPPSYRYYKAYYSLVDHLTGGQYSGISNYLSDPTSYAIGNYPYQTRLTAGDAIRGLGDGSMADTAAKIKTTLSDMFQDCSRWQMGMGIIKDPLSADVGKLELEHLSHFFDPSSIIADLGVVSGVSHSVALDYVFNQLKVGYGNQTYGALNGRDEFNTEQIYSYPETNIDKTLDLESPYRADIYGIEYTRANLINKTTTDADSDNDNFVITTAETTTGGAYNLYRPAAPGDITGVLFPSSIFNYDISPKTTLYRNTSLIKSETYPQSTDPGYGLKFQTSDKNRRLVSIVDGLTVNEKADYIPNDITGDPLFYPIIFKFKARMPINLFPLMDSNQYGCFQFTAYNNKKQPITLKGFPIEVGFYPGTNDVYDMILLCTPDTDLTQLVF